MSGNIISGTNAAATPLPADEAHRAAIARQRRFLLWRANKMAFWVLYDLAGGLVLLNLIALAAILLPPWILLQYLPVHPILVLAYGTVTASVVAAGLAGAVAGLLEDGEFSLQLVFRRMREFGARAAAIALIYIVCGSGVAASAWFYSTQVMPDWPLAGAVMTCICGAAAVPVALSGMYVLPALIHQRGSLYRTLRISLLLAARHSVITPGLLLLTLLYAVALLSTPVLLLLSGLPLVILSCCAYELLAREQAAAETLQRGESPSPAVADENDIFLNRGFNDFLFPWKI